MNLVSLLSPPLALVACGALFAQSDTRINCNAVPRDCDNSRPHHVWDRQPQMSDDSGSGPFVRQPAPRADRVTLHQLTHKVPKTAVKEYEHAMKAQAHGDREDAIEHLRKAIAIDPEFLQALNNLGVYLLWANRIDPGIEQFKRAIAVDPHAPLPYANLSLAFFQQHKFAEAEQAARRNATMDPLATTGPFILGESLLIQEKFTLEAEESLIKAAKRFPDARIPLAVVLANRGKLDSAKEALRLYLASGETNQADLANSVMHRLDSVNTRAPMIKSLR